MSLRKTLRPYILPLQEILADFQGMQFARALDIGAGTGLFLELFHRYGIIQRGLGVETNRQYFRKINEDLAIVGVDDIAGERFDLILFNDVLHHVDNKEELIRRYAADFLVDGGQVFVKEVDNRNLLYTCFSRLHDLIIAREFIQEISPREVKEILSNYEITFEGRKRILLYDHYWVLLKKPLSPAGPEQPGA